MTIDEDRGRVNLFKLLVQLLQTDMDIPDQLLSARYSDKLRQTFKTIVYFFTLASTSLKTISFIARICLTILNSLL